MKKVLVYIMVLSTLMLSVVALADVTHLSQSEFITKSANANTVVLDIRTADEFKQGHIEGAINIPHADILNDVSMLDQFAEKDMVFYCHSGGRVKRVTQFLREINYVEDSKLFHLKGDMRGWQGRGRPVSR